MEAMATRVPGCSKRASQSCSQDPEIRSQSRRSGKCENGLKEPRQMAARQSRETIYRTRWSDKSRSSQNGERRTGKTNTTPVPFRTVMRQGTGSENSRVKSGCKTISTDEPQQRRSRCLLRKRIEQFRGSDRLNNETGTLVPFVTYILLDKMYESVSELM